MYNYKDSRKIVITCVQSTHPLPATALCHVEKLVSSSQQPDEEKAGIMQAKMQRSLVTYIKEENHIKRKMIPNAATL